MGVAEFGPRSETTFMSTPPQIRLEPRARRYEASWHSLQSELDLQSARLQLLLKLTNRLGYVLSAALAVNNAMQRD
jgi:hypothetical protein